MSNLTLEEPAVSTDRSISCRSRRLGPSGEAAVVVLLLTGLAVAAFGSYVGHGGFYSDDWAALAKVKQAGYLGGVAQQIGIEPSRPLLAVLQLLPHRVFGENPQPDLVLALVLAVLLSTCFFFLLRELGVPALAAGTVSGLVLLFPWSDSTRLWAITSINDVALVLYLGGAIIALRAQRTSGRRFLLMHLCALGLWVASIFTYEATGALAFATGLLYFSRSPRKKAWLTWGADMVVVGVAIAVSKAVNGRSANPLSLQLTNARHMARGAAVLTTHAIFPVVGGHTWVVGAVLLVIAVAAVVAFVTKDQLLSAELRRALIMLAGSAVAIGLSYVMFIPAAYWLPQKPGLENRVNIIAALPIALFAYTFIALAVVLVVPRARWRSGLRYLVVTLIAMALAVDYGVRLHADEHVWTRAYAAERAELTSLRQALPHPGNGTTIFTFGVPAQVAPRMPVFYDTWDLYSAAQLMYRNASISAYPVFVGAHFACGPTGVTPGLPTPSSFQVLDPRVNGQRLPLPYGRVVFVDIITRVAKRISSPRDCTLAVAHFRPGPIESPRLLGQI